jgi:hypothetical protein
MHHQVMMKVKKNEYKKLEIIKLQIKCNKIYDIICGIFVVIIILGLLFILYITFNNKKSLNYYFLQKLYYLLCFPQ